MESFSQRAATATRDEGIRDNLRGALGTILAARKKAVDGVANWEQLREHANAVKMAVLSRLPDYLLELERSVTARGGRVVWADTGRDAVDFVVGLARRHGIDKIVKSKSMLGEEIDLNAGLEDAGIVPVETDLGEYIVQLSEERPFHLVAPALHKTKEDVRRLFVEKLQMKDTTDIESIAATARDRLRGEFLSSRMGITGVNFGVADSGTIVVVENEGNARLSMAVPQVHVAIMGIEKVIPRLSDLPVFLTLLTRSATGQRATSYVNLIQGCRKAGEPGGPEEFWLVLVDNGRSGILRDRQLRQTLGCIRCGACLNVCPVYQTIGGHSYGTVYQGPIGSILSPQLARSRESTDHPFASSLCGECHQVCPVKIEIPHILLRLRAEAQAERRRSSPVSLERLAFKLWARAATSPFLYASASRLARLLQLFSNTALGRRLVPPLKLWSRSREVPRLARRRFHDLEGRRLNGP